MQGNREKSPKAAFGRYAILSVGVYWKMIVYKDVSLDCPRGYLSPDLNAETQG